MVLQEEHHHNFQAKINSRSSRSSSKKNKAKKIPQRGLGVAQLEKLRIEEQQKTTNNMTMTPMGSSSNAVTPPPHLVVPVTPPQLQQQQQSQQQSVPFAVPRDPCLQIGFSASNAEELKYLSSIWSRNLSNLNTTETSIPENFPILSGNQHQYLSPIGLINNKTGFIPLSSRFNLQMEPPSNQNHSISSSHHEEGRIAGKDLRSPFQPETDMSFPCKPPNFCSPLLRPEELMALYGKSPSKSNYSKEGCSTLYQDNWRNSEIHASKRSKENGSSADSEFLSLGMSKLKQPQLQSQANTLHKPFYSFLPMGPSGHEVDADEEEDNTVNGVDTRLKL